LLDPEARRQIINAVSDVPCTFLIDWQEQPAESMFVTLPSKRERLETLTRFFREAKEPIIEKLRDAGIKVNDLPTSSQFIATGLAEQWKAILPQLERDPKVAVLPNKMYRAL